MGSFSTGAGEANNRCGPTFDVLGSAAVNAAFASSTSLLEQGASAGHDRNVARVAALVLSLFIILLLHLPDKHPSVRGMRMKPTTVATPTSRASVRGLVLRLVSVVRAVKVETADRDSRPGVKLVRSGNLCGLSTQSP